MNTVYHTPVLYEEVLNGLNIKENKIYVDRTFGGGGHSKGILERLGSDGKLIVFDQDKDSRQNLFPDERLVFVQHNFRYLKKFLQLYNITKVDGILADLGVSSYHFNEAERGFSTRYNGPLDMRMNQLHAKTAAEVLLTYSEHQLQKIFQEYGEIRNTNTLAKYIVQHRLKTPLKTIDEFKSLIQPVIIGNPNKYLAQVFQAVRIEVNDEIEALKELLQQTVEVLSKSGRIVVISFHSLEDRIVKNFFRNGIFSEDDKGVNVFGEKKKLFNLLTKKPITPLEGEVKQNPRSRSAKLRIAERL